MKIELSPELTKKALEIGATHVTPNLGCFKKVDEQYIYCNYGFGWSEYDHWSKLEDEIDDGKVFEIDFDPPKLELLAEIERLNAAMNNIIERSNNGDIGTSKVRDMREIAEKAIK